MVSTLLPPSCSVTSCDMVDRADEMLIFGFCAKSPVTVLRARAYTGKLVSVGSGSLFVAYWLNCSAYSDDFTNAGLVPTAVSGGTKPDHTAVSS